MSKADKIVTTFIFFVCVLSLVLINVFAYGNAVGNVVVEVDGKQYAKYNLAEINSSEIIEIKTQYGYNKIELLRDGVRVIEADCDDKFDVKAGKITRSGEYIICLPHRMIIRLEGGTTDADVLSY